ncbi:MAG TPA: polysaccharide biosynthesis/export family protein [Paludibacteraceae bacterium]|nr:polysaccharide biosynthesis/export family protein [Paludibacteraceae bacterium]
MKHLLHIIFTVLVVLSFSSCYNYKSIGLLQENKSLPVYAKEDYSDYKICVNDEIIFRLITTDETISKLISSNQSGNSSQMISYRVYPDGTVDIPFLNRVQVKGLTTNEAENLLKKEFREIIPDAEVKLSIANKSFTVIGEAGTGVFPVYKDKLTIYQALAMSGDLKLSGDFRHVKILRAEEGKTEILEFDIRPASVIESKYYYVYPNDIIYVQRASSSFFKVNNYSSFLGLISSSLTLLFSVLYYIKL